MRRTAVAAAVAISLAAVAAAGGEVALPKDYQKWERSKQKIVTDKNSLFYGIHYIYVDKKGMPAYQREKGYPEGARFVVEFFTLKADGGKPVEGKRNMIVLMKRDKSRKETGGWLFAAYGPDGKPSDLDPVKNCFECHDNEAKDREYVISRFTDFR